MQYRYDYTINGTDKTFTCTPQYMNWMNEEALKDRNHEIHCTRKEIDMFYHELNVILHLLDFEEIDKVLDNIQYGDAFVLI